MPFSCGAAAGRRRVHAQSAGSVHVGREKRYAVWRHRSSAHRTQFGGNARSYRRFMQGQGLGRTGGEMKPGGRLDP